VLAQSLVEYGALAAVRSADAALTSAAQYAGSIPGSWLVLAATAALAMLFVVFRRRR
jgi:LPXTG-motif cell wall-anchored protein